MPTFRLPGPLGMMIANSAPVVIGDAGAWIAGLASRLGVTSPVLYPRPPGTFATPAPTTTLADQTVDARSEKVIATLLPEVRPFARSLVLKAAEAGIVIKVISGTRSYEEQDRLYAQGRTTPGNIVTKAKAGHSNHNFGIAFDIGVFSSGKYLPESPSYRKVGAIGIGIGLEWGGNWKTFEDQPHYELHPNWAADFTEEQMLTEFRARKKSGRELFI